MEGEEEEEGGKEKRDALGRGKERNFKVGEKKEEKKPSRSWKRISSSYSSSFSSFSSSSGRATIFKPGVSVQGFDFGIPKCCLSKMFKNSDAMLLFCFLFLPPPCEHT